MITKEELQDWLAESERKSHADKLEKYIDKEIKRNTIYGKTTFFIQTSVRGSNFPEKTSFHEVWFMKGLSKDNREIAINSVLKKYLDFGIDVKRTTVDCGYHSHEPALQFSKIDSVLKKEEK